MAALAYLIRTVAYLMRLAILARALISWVRADPYNPLVQFLYRVTEPVLRPLRRLLPLWQGVDLSPILALVVIQLAEWILVGVILGI
jgi:YggT family protein